MSENNKFTARGKVLDNWKTETFGSYTTYILLVETEENYKQVLKISYFKKDGCTIDFNQQIKNYPCIVSGYVKGRTYTNKKGEQDVFTSLIGHDFNILYSEAPKPTQKPVVDISEPTQKDIVLSKTNTEELDAVEEDLPF